MGARLGLRLVGGPTRCNELWVANSIIMMKSQAFVLGQKREMRMDIMIEHNYYIALKMNHVS